MNAPIASDYQVDFAIWIHDQIAKLRAREFDQLDIDNLIEELDSMGISSKRELYHRLETLLKHLLKCQMQPHRISANWLGTIRDQRRRIGSLLKQSPSLARLILEYLDEVYPHAVAGAVDETRQAHSAFPASNPYSVAQLLDTQFLPLSASP